MDAINNNEPQLNSLILDDNQFVSRSDFDITRVTALLFSSTNKSKTKQQMAI